MIDNKVESPEDLSRHDMARLVLDMFHRIMVHHTLWFREVEHQLGMEKALDVMHEAYHKSFDIQIQRLARTLGFEMKEGIPQPLLDMSRDDLLTIMKTLGMNWIAGDGVWFQAVETMHPEFP